MSDVLTEKQLVELLRAECRKYGLRGFCRQHGLSPSIVSRTLSGHVPVSRRTAAALSFDRRSIFVKGK